MSGARWFAPTPTTTVSYPTLHRVCCNQTHPLEQKHKHALNPRLTLWLWAQPLRRWALRPGSFYHDEAAGLLYYWPLHTDGGYAPTGPVGVVAPTLDRLVELDHATQHTLENLTFVDTTYFADGQGLGAGKQSRFLRVEWWGVFRPPPLKSRGGISRWGGSRFYISRFSTPPFQAPRWGVKGRDL